VARTSLISSVTMLNCLHDPNHSMEGEVWAGEWEGGGEP
jgi:hypothetical protein